MKKYLIQILFIIFLIKQYQNKNCMKYYNFCIQCNEKTDLCDYCFFSVFKPDLEGGCIGSKKCSPKSNLCLECNEDSTLCTKCENDFIPDNNGGCTLTKNCDVSFRGSCQTCKDTYSLVNDGNPYLECKKLPKDEDKSSFCKKYDDEGICSECFDNYYLTLGNKHCSNTSHCYISKNEICTECMPGFYLDKSDNNTCKPYDDNNFFYCKETLDGEKCSACRQGFFLSKDNKCTISNNCLESKLGTYLCQKCEENYYLTSEGSCSITENCRHLLPSQMGKCDICEKNYYLNTKTGICKSNLEDNIFKYCEKGSDACESCITYYHLGKDNKCSKSLNCSESINGTCVKCDEGTYLTENNNKCIHSSNCTESDDYYRCTECEKGFFYNYTSNECINDEKFDKKFENCKNLDYIGENCIECHNNYYLNKTDKKCYLAQEDEKLYKCSETNQENNCTKCERYYFLGKLDNKCSSIFGCDKSENVNTCLECNPNYCLTEGRCNYTSIIFGDENGFCFKCFETNEGGKGCKKCFDGYSVSEEGFCINLDYCEEFEDDKCLKCKILEDDDFGIHLCMNEKFGCVETYNDNCIRCDDIYDLDKCTQCSEGYKIEDGECIKIEEDIDDN